jgi:antitoxin VapB
MTTTRVFRSGNSQAVRIPAEMAFEDNTEVTITRSGDVITIYPKRTGSMAEMIAALRALPSVSVVEDDERIEMPDRDWD